MSAQQSACSAELQATSPSKLCLSQEFERLCLSQPYSRQQTACSVKPRVKSPREPWLTRDMSPTRPAVKMPALPTELWLDIASYLTPREKCSLALTSSQLHSIFSCSLSQLSSAHRVVKLDFLMLFDKQRKNHRLCHWCVKFHPRNSQTHGKPSSQDLARESNWHQLCRKVRATPVGQSDAIRLTGIDMFPWHAVQLAMRAHRHGLGFGLPLSDFKFRTTPFREWQNRFEAVVHQGQLLLEIDGIWTSADRHQPVSCARGRPQCVHINFDPVKITRQFLEMVAPGYDGPFGLRCKSCPSEYVINMVELESGERAAGITRYLDLGDGMSPFEGQWQQLANPEPLDSDVVEYTFHWRDNLPIRKRFLDAIAERASTKDAEPSQHLWTKQWRTAPAVVRHWSNGSKALEANIKLHGTENGRWSRI